MDSIAAGRSIEYHPKRSGGTLWKGTFAIYLRALVFDLSVFVSAKV
jgi:hypothetical protein